MENQYVYFTKDKSAPYSDMVVLDNGLMFLSGLVSEDPITREELYGDITFETKTLFDNLKLFLEANGSDMNHVVKVDIVLRNFEDRTLMNEEYVKHFDKDHMPSRICYGDVNISGECKIEVSVIATRK